MFYNPQHKDGHGGPGGQQGVDERLYAAHMRHKEAGGGGGPEGGHGGGGGHHGGHHGGHGGHEGMPAYDSRPRSHPGPQSHHLKHSVESMKNETRSEGGGDHEETDGDSHASSMWFPAVTLEIKEDEQPWGGDGGGGGGRPSTSAAHAASHYFHHHVQAAASATAQAHAAHQAAMAAAAAAAAGGGGGKGLVCNNCYETFRELASLRQHLLANKGVCCFVCDKCGKLYETLAALTVHEISHSASDHPASTPSTPSTPAPSSSAPEDCLSYAGGGDTADGWPPVIAVPAASEAGRSLIMFAGSTKFEEPGGGGTPGGGRGTTRAGNRASSRAVDSGRPFACSIEGCNRSYLCKSHLLGHIKEAHAVGYTFACDICSRRFQRNATLKRHKLLVHAKEEEEVAPAEKQHPFACDACDKTFPRNATLKRHRMLVHAKVAYSPGHVFECDVCNKRFRRNSTLKRHKMFVHSDVHDDRPFSCNYDECHKRYKHKNHLKTHMAKHCGESACVDTHVHIQQAPPPPRVKSCTIGIQVGGTMHKRSSSSGGGYVDNSFACEICEKTFPRNYTLNRHKMLVHSDTVVGRPYVCDYEECGKSYKLKYHLKDHMRKHTKVSMLRF